MNKLSQISKCFERQFRPSVSDLINVLICVFQHSTIDSRVWSLQASLGFHYCLHGEIANLSEQTGQD